eukprot:1159965-Pelagomonas_calceolata.AAC.17
MPQVVAGTYSVLGSLCCCVPAYQTPFGHDCICRGAHEEQYMQIRGEQEKVGAHKEQYMQIRGEQEKGCIKSRGA